MTRLRTKWGVDEAEVKQRFPQFANHFDKEIENIYSKGWISFIEEICNLTPKGKLMADQAAMELFI